MTHARADICLLSLMFNNKIKKKMIYKDFVAEAAQKIMAAAIAHKTAGELNNGNEELGNYARGSVNAAKALADALDQDWQSTPVDDIHRFSDKEEFFDNYVSWTKNR